MSSIVTFRPREDNLNILQKVDNKTEFLNKVIDLYKIAKLKKQMIEGFSDSKNVDMEWVNFDDKEYYELMMKEGM